MKTLIPFFVLIVVFSLPVYAQAPGASELSFFNEEPHQEFAPPDSGFHLIKRKLQPDKMSWMERGLWGDSSGLFRKIGLVADPLTPEARKQELELRRTMLTMHQIGGFVTEASMIGAIYFGQRIIDTGDRTYNSGHQAFVAATIVSYSATGLLAILSPPPLIRRDEFSTTTVHKALAWVHFVGMVVTPILGSMIGRHDTQAQKAHFHQISAYITFTALTASLVTITLP